MICSIIIPGHVFPAIPLIPVFADLYIGFSGIIVVWLTISIIPVSETERHKSTNVPLYNYKPRELGTSQSSPPTSNPPTVIMRRRWGWKYINDAFIQFTLGEDTQYYLWDDTCNGKNAAYSFASDYALSKISNMHFQVLKSYFCCAILISNCLYLLPKAINMDRKAPW